MWGALQNLVFLSICFFWRFWFSSVKVLIPRDFLTIMTRCFGESEREIFVRQLTKAWSMKVHVDLTSWKHFSHFANQINLPRTTYVTVNRRRFKAENCWRSLLYLPTLSAISLLTQKFRPVWFLNCKNKFHFKLVVFVLERKPHPRCEQRAITILLLW